MEEEEKSSGSRSSWDKPEGRIKRCGKLRLLKTNDQLYIPFTQEPAPMTEDRLEEHAGVLLRLGTDAMGSQLRARMMSASLLSDMESFKVVNSDEDVLIALGGLIQPLPFCTAWRRECRFDVR